MKGGLHLPARVTEGDFAGWLRDAMKARRMTTRLVAMRTGLNHATVSRLMNRAREPLLSTAIRLVRLLEREPRAGDARSEEAPTERPPGRAA